MRYFSIVFSLFLSLPLLAQDDPRLYASLFEKKYNSARTLQANFLEQYSENSKVLRKESGSVSFLRPGKMRWDYSVPENNLFLVDGKMTWFYVPSDHTVMRVPARETSDWRAPIALLAGQWKLSKACSRISIVPSPSTPPANVVLSCILRGNPAEKSSPASPAEIPITILFEIVRSSGELVRLTIADAPGGVQTEFFFRNWSFNPTLSDSLFHFSPPPDTVIVNGLLPSATPARP